VPLLVDINRVSSKHHNFHHFIQGQKLGFLGFWALGKKPFLNEAYSSGLSTQVCTHKSTKLGFQVSIKKNFKK